MDFKQAENRFRQLKSQFASGALSEQEFKSQLEDLMFQDERGDWWMIGYETEKWYRNDGTDWVQADPPKLDGENTNKVAKWGCVTTLIGIPSLMVAAFIVVALVWNRPIIPSTGPDGTEQALSTSVPTRTLRPTTAPTSSPRATATPNVAATEQYKAFFSIIRDYEQKGHINTVDGEYVLLDSYSENMAYLDYYKNPTLANRRVVKDFVFNAHFHWASAIQNPSESGCGIVFGIRDDTEGFQVFLDRSRIWMQDDNGVIGKTRGTGRVSFSNPADATFTMAVNNNQVYVYVNDEFVGEYTLSQSASTEGQIGYTLLSGTNKDYGTLCEITDAKLWVIGR